MQLPSAVGGNSPPQFAFQAAERNSPVVDPVIDENWDSAYQNSHFYKGWWDQAHQPGDDWPEGVRIFSGKLYHLGKLCVPEDKASRLIRSFHAVVGHALQLEPTRSAAQVGGERPVGVRERRVGDERRYIKRWLFLLAWLY